MTPPVTEPEVPVPVLLARSWDDAWAALGATPPSGLLASLLAAYAAPHRRYHTLQHLEECLASAAADAALAQRPAEVALALWFHDAVYDLHRHDNEAASAAWAGAALRAAGAPAAAVERVQALVLATRHDVPTTSPDACLVVDLDLRILAAPPARFAEYEAQIRAEYGHVPDVFFHAKRREVLQSFLDREAIFLTPACRERFEAQARANLQAAVARMADAE
jgi:predicted metal-dependent HD superfamily phosphohydrolase